MQDMGTLTDEVNRIETMLRKTRDMKVIKRKPAKQHVHITGKGKQKEKKTKKPKKKEKKVSMKDILGECISRHEYTVDYGWFYKDILAAVMRFLDAKDLCKISLLNRSFYLVAGNDIRWVTLCNDMKIAPKNDDTYRKCYMLYTYYSNSDTDLHCCVCKGNTARGENIWGYPLCVTCRHTKIITVSQAKKFFDIEDADIEGICTQVYGNRVDIKKGELYDRIVQINGIDEVKRLYKKHCDVLRKRQVLL